MRIDAVCGPSTSNEDTTCTQGTVLDSVTIGGAPPPPPPTPVLYVDQHNPVCSDTGLGEPGRALLHDRRRGLAGQRRADGPGRLRHLPRVDQRADLRDRGRADPLHGGARRLGATSPAGRTASRSRTRATSRSTASPSARRAASASRSRTRRTSRSPTTTSATPGSRSAARRKSGIYLASVRDSIVVGNTVDHNTSYGIYLNGSTRNLDQGQRDLQQRPGVRARRLRDPALQLDRATRSTRTARTTTRTRGSSPSRARATTSSSTTSATTTATTASTTTRRRVRPSSGNTVYHNVTAGINIEGGSTGATIANNISVDNGVASPRTHSDIRVENGSTAGHDDGLRPRLPDHPRRALHLELRPVLDARRVPGRDAGRSRTGSRPIPGGSTWRRATSTSPPDRRRSTRRTRACRASRPTTSRGTAASTTRARPTPARARSPTTTVGRTSSRP